MAEGTQLIGPVHPFGRTQREDKEPRRTSLEHVRGTASLDRRTLQKMFEQNEREFGPCVRIEPYDPNLPHSSRFREIACKSRVKVGSIQPLFLRIVVDNLKERRESFASVSRDFAAPTALTMGVPKHAGSMLIFVHDGSLRRECVGQFIRQLILESGLKVTNS